MPHDKLQFKKLQFILPLPHLFGNIQNDNNKKMQHQLQSYIAKFQIESCQPSDK